MFVYSKKSNWSFKSIADLGETTTMCSIINAQSGPFFLNCKSGAIQKVTNAGAFTNDSDAYDRGVCSTDSLGDTNAGFQCEILESKKNPIYHAF